jgi:hypothetical protein
MILDTLHIDEYFCSTGGQGNCLHVKVLIILPVVSWIKSYATSVLNDGKCHFGRYMVCLDKGDIGSSTLSSRCCIRDYLFGVSFDVGVSEPNWVHTALALAHPNDKKGRQQDPEKSNIYTNKWHEYYFMYPKS